MDQVPNFSQPSSLDFDAFLIEATNEIEQQDEADLFDLAVTQKLTDALREKGVRLLIGVPSEEQSLSFRIISSQVYEELYESLKDTYDSDTLLSDTISFEEYARTSISTKLFEIYGKQDLLINQVVSIMRFVEQIENNDKPTTYEAINHKKKSAIARDIVNGTIEVGDEWFTVLNDILPGEKFDPNSSADQSYISEALIQYAQGESLRQALLEMAPDVVKLAMDSFQNDPDKEAKINTVIGMLPTIVMAYRQSPTNGPAQIDEIARMIGAPSTLNDGLKIIAQLYADKLKEFGL